MSARAGERLPVGAGQTAQGQEVGTMGAEAGRGAVGVLERGGRLLEFSSDVGIRSQLFTPASFGHPAKLHLGLAGWIIERYTRPGDTLLDPMAGSGGLLLAATMQRHVIVRDVEPAYLALLHENAAHILRACGLFAGRIDVAAADAREPWGVQADHIIMSPPYGCAASVSPNTRRCLPYRFRDPNKMTARSICSVTFYYGQHPAQVGHLRSVRYWDAMRAVYSQAHAALRAGGWMVLVIKDHVKDGRRVTVAADTAALCESLGFALVEQHARLVRPLSLWQRRRKEKGLPVVEDESVLALRRVER